MHWFDTEFQHWFDSIVKGKIWGEKALSLKIIPTKTEFSPRFFFIGIKPKKPFFYNRISLKSQQLQEP